MIKRAKRLDPIRGFGIDRVAAAVDQPARASTRWPVLRMENLDTDLPLPPEAVGVTARSLETAEANSWLPFTGDIQLREAIAAFLAARTGHPFDPEREIVVTCGGLEGILNTLLVTIDPGDEVIVTDPTYAGIVNRIHLAGGTPKPVPFKAVEREWRLDRDALVESVGDRTTSMLLMSPSMPSGGTFDEEDWRLICDLCRERDLFLVYDAAMERILFDGRPLVHPLHFEGMAERTVVAGSLSKEHRMIGWRVGWVAGPPETVEDAGWAHVYNTTAPVGIARAAAAAVLRGQQDHVAACVAELERRRDALLAGLPGWPFVSPGGGWSALLDVAELGLDAPPASRLLLEESAIAATAMVGWGGPVADRHVRFVFSAEPVEAIRTIPGRLAGGTLAAAVSERS